MFVIRTIQDAKQVRPARDTSRRYSDKLLKNNDKDAMSINLATDRANLAASKVIKKLIEA